jgi:hypothetical protein
MSYSDLTDRLLSVYDQIVIYGAKGWIGKSAVSVVFSEKAHRIQRQILLVGSKTEQLINSGELTQIYSANDAKNFVSKNCIFLNAAYLRREKLDLYSPDEYIRKNREIIGFGENLLRQKKIKTFINLSSGVASQNIDSVKNQGNSIYAKCKIDDEVLIKNASDSASAALINCRVYSISGRFLNEFENLAFSLFMKQALTKPHKITVESQNTYRSYLDAAELTTVLFHISLNSTSYMIDSGGFLVKLGQLADKIATMIPEASVTKLNYGNNSAHYYGDFEGFNNLAAKFEIKLLDIEGQITETLKAFRNQIS